MSRYKKVCKRKLLYKTLFSILFNPICYNDVLSQGYRDMTIDDKLPPPPKKKKKYLYIYKKLDYLQNIKL